MQLDFSSAKVLDRSLFSLMSKAIQRPDKTDKDNAEPATCRIDKATILEFRCFITNLGFKRDLEDPTIGSGTAFRSRSVCIY